MYHYPSSIDTIYLAVTFRRNRRHTHVHAHSAHFRYALSTQLPRLIAGMQANTRSATRSHKCNCAHKGTRSPLRACAAAALRAARYLPRHAAGRWPLLIVGKGRYGRLLFKALPAVCTFECAQKKNSKRDRPRENATCAQKDGVSETEMASMSMIKMMASLQASTPFVSVSPPRAYFAKQQKYHT